MSAADRAAKRKVKTLCPRCESSRVEKTCVGQIGGGNIDTSNAHRCDDCGFVWKWAAIELTPRDPDDALWMCWTPKQETF